MVETSLRTLMRTIDLIIAGFFSPAAIAAVGLANIYGRLPARIGRSIGDGTIAIASQDTGGDMLYNRNEVLSQALVLGIITSIPFVLFGLFFSEFGLRVLGAEHSVIEYGMMYLAIILIFSPARHITLISARAIQGTGDTRSPMVINVGANVINILLSVVLAFGLGPAPSLSVTGIALATAFADSLATLAFLLFISSHLCELSFVIPSRLIILKQLIIISSPQLGEGLTGIVIEFPLYAILLILGQRLTLRTI